MSKTNGLIEMAAVFGVIAMFTVVHAGEQQNRSSASMTYSIFSFRHRVISASLLSSGLYWLASSRWSGSRPRQARWQFRQSNEMKVVLK